MESRPSYLPRTQASSQAKFLAVWSLCVSKTAAPGNWAPFIWSFPLCRIEEYIAATVFKLSDHHSPLLFGYLKWCQDLLLGAAKVIYTLEIVEQVYHPAKKRWEKFTNIENIGRCSRCAIPEKCFDILALVDFGSRDRLTTNWACPLLNAQRPSSEMKLADLDRLKVLDQVADGGIKACVLPIIYCACWLPIMAYWLSGRSGLCQSPIILPVAYLCQQWRQRQIMTICA